MLAGDWANMSQAVWRSPLLSLLPARLSETDQTTLFGTGARFKRDLLAYLDFYGRRKTGSLVDQLQKFDFQAIRAVLIASVPSRERHSRTGSSISTLWGWPALKDALRQVPLRDREKSKGPHVVVQVWFPIHSQDTLFKIVFSGDSHLVLVNYMLLLTLIEEVVSHT